MSVSQLLKKNDLNVNCKEFTLNNDNVSIGNNTVSGTSGVSIGKNAGASNVAPGSGSVLIGDNAGASQDGGAGSSSVAIGLNAGQNSSSGLFSVAIGANTSAQNDKSIVISAVGTALFSNGDNQTHIAPIRSEASVGALKALYYNPASGEITHVP